MENGRRDSIRIDECPNTIDSHCPPLHDECQDKQRHRTRCVVISCHGFTLRPDTFAQTFRFDGELLEYEDVQRRIHHEDDAERDGGEEKVGRVSVHSVKIAAEKKYRHEYIIC